MSVLTRIAGGVFTALVLVQMCGCVPDDGTSGFTALIDTAIENPGLNCTDGGLVVYSGLDNGDVGGTARDGILQSGERDMTDYVCNGGTGPIGPAGFNSLINPVAEAPGANCASGGVRLDAGLDNGDGGGTASNGTLEAGEVDQTSYACDGNNGSNGITSLVDIVVENPGANCTDGGLVVYTGLDNGDGGGTANDGTLQSGERDNTDYVCNGSNGSTGMSGFNSLINLATEAAGANCQFGGVKIDVGLDNGDGSGIAGNAALEAGEVDQTSYVCDGGVSVTGQLGVTDLTLANCTIVDHETLISDDRGGVAVSGSHFFVAGDGGIGRFDVADMANPANLTGAPPVDGLVSDLGSGTVYSLSQDGVSGYSASPSDTRAACNSNAVSAVFTHLVELDSSFAVVGNVALSQSISINSCHNGMFAGPGFMILLTDTNYFRISFADGTVTDLGARTPGAINPTANSYNCENWAFWGVAEYDGTNHYIVFRDEGTPDIVRNQAGTATVTTVKSFTGTNPLSDMCSFTVAPSLDRWYFHYEGGSSEIGGTAETAGFCDASFQ